MANTYRKNPTQQIGTMDSQLIWVVESFQSGYPQVAALLGAREQFRIFRRFATVRMRLILYKQDQITQLEAELHAIDNKEKKLIFLGARRKDQNQERAAKLQQLDTALIEYGTSHLLPCSIIGRIINLVTTETRQRENLESMEKLGYLDRKGA